MIELQERERFTSFLAREEKFSKCEQTTNAGALADPVLATGGDTSCGCVGGFSSQTLETASCKSSVWRFCVFKPPLRESTAEFA